jgi:hypothetical protein
LLTPAELVVPAGAAAVLTCKGVVVAAAAEESFEVTGAAATGAGPCTAGLDADAALGACAGGGAVPTVAGVFCMGAVAPLVAAAGEFDFRLTQPAEARSIKPAFIAAARINTCRIF